MQGTIGNTCGICRRSDQLSSPHSAYSALSGLVRALVRFHYDEWTYNTHWGGNGPPESLLCDPNPIVENADTSGFTRRPEDIEEFVSLLFDPPHPDYDKGIALFAGHDERLGRLPPQEAIETAQSSLFKRTERRLLNENYFDVEREFAKPLKELLPTITVILPKETSLFRARLGIAKRFVRDDGGWKFATVYQPYVGKDIGAPPPRDATPGRLNRSGVSYLDLSTDAATAAAEIRPHPGHLLSIGRFRNVGPIRLADFGAIDIAAFSSSDVRLEIFHLGHTIGREISVPITPEERHKYSVTHLLADILRRLRYDGIRFPSSVASGDNVCVFRPSLFASDPSAGKVVRVKTLKYDLDEEECLLKPQHEIELPLDSTV
jgi:hypothetical protein